MPGLARHRRRCEALSGFKGCNSSDLGTSLPPLFGSCAPCLAPLLLVMPRATSACNASRRAA
eukprot:32224-Pelagomonas_calceolata.AAC.7